MSPRFAVAVVFSLALCVVAQPAQADPWNGAQKWGVGFHLTGMGLGPAETDDDAGLGDDPEQLDLGGAGLQVRYRLNRRWEFEAEIDHVAGELENGGLARDYKSMTLAAMFHINPNSQWTWSVIGGFGGGTDDVRFVEMADGKPSTRNATFSHGHVHLGVALERRFENIGVGAQLRAVGMGRNEEDADGPLFEGSDEPTPREEGGGRFNLHVTYYF
jgi:hypothetical protein